jgi:hypothetical protein
MYSHINCAPKNETVKEKTKLHVCMCMYLKPISVLLITYNVRIPFGEFMQSCDFVPIFQTVFETVFFAMLFIYSFILLLFIFTFNDSCFLCWSSNNHSWLIAWNLK